MDFIITCFVWVISFVYFRPATDGASAPPDNVRVFALTFMDLDLTEKDRSYTQILISTASKSRLRVKVPFASESKYSDIRWSDDAMTYFNFTNGNIDFSQAEGEVVLENKGAIIIAKDTVNIYGSHAMAGSGEAYLALPLTRQAHDFYLPSYPSQNAIGYSFYGLAAAADTCVDVYWIQNDTYKHHRRIRLSSGDVFQEYSTVRGEDFTGLYIQSAQGVAVFSGHECAQVPTGVQFCDHLLEQIPPVHEWGAEVVVPGIPGRNSQAGYLIRIIAAELVMVDLKSSGTEVYLSAEHGCNCRGNGNERIEFSTCTQSCTTDRGDFIELEVLDASKPVIVTCQPRCLVVQYGPSREKVAQEHDDPDPFMSVITPTSHYSNAMTYVTPDYLHPTENRLLDYANYLAVVVPRGYEDGVRLDGRVLDGTVVKDAVDNKYTVLSVSGIRHGQHKIEHVQTGVMIAAFAYGNTPAKSETRPTARSSYGFPVVYTISGETVKGDWMEELVVKPGDDIVTITPKYCEHTEVNSVHDTFTLSTNNTVPSCTTAHMTPLVLNRLRSGVNQAICDGILCDGVPDNVFISHLKLSHPNQVNGLDFRMVTTLDTPMSTLLQCKYDVISYVTYASHWSAVLTDEGLASCRQFIQDLRYTKSVFSCLSESV